MAEKVAKLGVKREEGYLYFIDKNGDVSRAAMARGGKKGGKASKVAKAGVTKMQQWVRINDRIDLVDSPGILWPKLDNDELALNLASMGIIKEEILPVDKVAVHILKKLDASYKEILSKELGIKEFDLDDIVNMYEIISKYKNIPFKDGEADYDRVSTLILNLVRNETIKNITFD